VRRSFSMYVKQTVVSGPATNPLLRRCGVPRQLYSCAAVRIRCFPPSSNLLCPINLWSSTIPFCSVRTRSPAHIRASSIDWLKSNSVLLRMFSGQSPACASIFDCTKSGLLRSHVLSTVSTLDSKSPLSPSAVWKVF